MSLPPDELSKAIMLSLVLANKEKCECKLCKLWRKLADKMIKEMLQDEGAE